MLKAMKTFCLERPDENLITRKGCQTKNAANVQRRFRRFPGEYRIPHQATTKAHLKFFTCTRFHQSSHFYSKFSPCDEEENWKIMSERNWIKLRASFILSIVAAHSMLLCFPCFVQCHFFNCRIIVNQNVSQQRSPIKAHEEMLVECDSKEIERSSGMKNLTSNGWIEIFSTDALKWFSNEF